MSPLFETERLIARRYTPGDAEEAFEMYGDPEVTRFIREDGKPEDSVDALRTNLVTWLAKYEAMGSGYGFWALIEKESGRIVGTVIVKPLPGHDHIEIGWHLVRRDWGKGFATEAGLAAAEYAFNRLGLDRVVAVVHPGNVRSQAVARRIGMRHEGQILAYDLNLEIFSLEKS